MENRKRSYDGNPDVQYPISGIPPKKMRLDDMSGGSREDPNKTITRLLLTRLQFSKLIGKGGQTITNIKNSTGSFIKGTDVDEDARLVIVTGTVDQVLAGFDMISDLLQPSPQELANLPVPRAPDLLTFYILLEHSKAGKAVGSKGAMIQNMKLKSGSQSIRIDKDPIEIQGQVLRKLTIEGNLDAVRRAHLLIQELYADPTSLGQSVAYSRFIGSNNGGGGGGLMDAPHMGGGGGMGGGMSGGGMGGGGGGHHHRSGYGAGPSAYGDNSGSGHGGGGMSSHHGLPPMSSSSSATSSTQLVPIPFPSLVGLGVQAETVRQLTEMKAYLWRHFSLDLSISREVMGGGGGNSNAGGPPSLSSSSYGGGGGGQSYGGGSGGQYYGGNNNSRLDSYNGVGGGGGGYMQQQQSSPQQNNYRSNNMGGGGMGMMNNVNDRGSNSFMGGGGSGGGGFSMGSSGGGGGGMGMMNNNSSNNHRNNNQQSAPQQSIESVMEARRHSNPRELCFAVPRTVVGAVIGKGGQHLKELQATFNVKAYIEKEDYNGQRLVIMSYLPPSGSSGGDGEGATNSAETDQALQNAREQIHRVIEEQLQQREQHQQQQQGGGGGGGRGDSGDGDNNHHHGNSRDD